MSTCDDDDNSHSRSLGYEHGADRPCNNFPNPCFHHVVNARASRRGFMLGSLAAVTTGLCGLHVMKSKTALASLSEHGLIVMNHEYGQQRFKNAEKWTGQATDEETMVFVEINEHGCSLLRIRKGADGNWSIASDPLNRRNTGLTSIDAANPRAENSYDRIARWSSEGSDHAAAHFQWDHFVLAGNKASSAILNDEALGGNSIDACRYGLWCGADSRLWIQTVMGDVDPAIKGTLEPIGTNQLLAADPKTGDVRRFLTGPWGHDVTGVITTPDQKTMFVSFQHPEAHVTDEQFAAGDEGSGFPGYNGAVPRSATLVVTREDGGLIAA